MNSTSDGQMRHLKRWIKASILKELRLHSSGVRVFVEGEDKAKPDEKHIEIRIDGPYVKPLAGGTFSAYIEMNLLGNSTRSQNNVYDRENLQGIVLEMTMRDFCITRTGNRTKTPEDDGTVVGTMQQMPAEYVKLSDFGQIDTAEVYQATAEGHYEMFFSFN